MPRTAQDLDIRQTTYFPTYSAQNMVFICDPALSFITKRSYICGNVTVSPLCSWLWNSLWKEPGLVRGSTNMSAFLPSKTYQCNIENLNWRACAVLWTATHGIAVKNFLGRWESPYICESKTEINPHLWIWFHLHGYIPNFTLVCVINKTYISSLTHFLGLIT